jgi:hypothetical protein
MLMRFRTLQWSTWQFGLAPGNAMGTDFMGAFNLLDGRE